MTKGIEIITEGLELTTRGLDMQGLPELVVKVKMRSLIPAAKDLLTHLLQLNDHELFQPGKRIDYGYWPITLEARGSKRLELLELSHNGNRFVRGVTLVLTFWREQTRICEHFGKIFTPPRCDQLVGISHGVLQGKPVVGVRYNPDDLMSGWVIKTDLYDGNMDALTTEHLYHLTAKRPDLTKYLALPAGFRIDFRGQKRVWFDKEVTKWH